MNIRENLTFGFEQTFTVPNWWEKEGFCNISDTPFKREKMLELATNLAALLKGRIIESLDIWKHIQFEVLNEDDIVSFYVTMDPGSIEVKTIPKLANEISEYIQPLFKAAEQSNLVPYRNWWYGIQSGTEGGCHVNMGGFNKETNPFVEKPYLLVKYAAYLHNRPFLTYPFMGVDVGPGGNAQRFDEKNDYKDIKDIFNIIKPESFKSLNGLHQIFKDTSLVSDRSSAPSFRKIESPLHLIEDRAHEALRTAEDFELITDLKLKIFEYLDKQKEHEELLDFPEIHKKELTSFSLWEGFQFWCNELELNPVSYQRFFDRQFPILPGGENLPTQFKLKEGKCPREILEVYKNEQGEVTGKKVDTSKKRLELYYSTLTEEQFFFEIQYSDINEQSEVFRHNGYLGFGEKGSSYYQYLDLTVNQENPIVQIKLVDKLTKEVIESSSFNLSSMMFE